MIFAVRPGEDRGPSRIRTHRRTGPATGDYGFGTHRVPLERGYYEAFHQDNVEAVNVRNNPITRITSTGIELDDGSHHEVDVIVMATGFDAGTGSSRIDLRGRGGRSLAEEWGRTSVRRWASRSRASPTC